MSLDQSILDLVSKSPGLKGREIANKLGIDKKEANSALWKLKNRGSVLQDSSYCWHPAPKGGSRRKSETSGKRKPPETSLARLCQYYLECLSMDDDAGVSLFANSWKELDYAELPALPDLGEYLTMDSEGTVSGLLSRLQRSDSRMTPHVGFPVRLRKFVSKKGWEGFFAEPIFLIPLDEESLRSGTSPKLGEESPSLNSGMLKWVAQGAPSALMQEAANLTEDLGLWGSDVPDLDELVARLADLRPEWDWREAIDTEKLSDGTALKDIEEGGIYNRAIIFGVERSKFTMGLETELSKLQYISESDLNKTALGHWLGGNPTNGHEEEGDATPLIEPIPLNTEQRSAIRSAFSNPLTVVTGPPGTGKSQVVSALLMNASMQGKQVLFASKNNKAVDVVESRVNTLGTRPVLLRLGRGSYQDQLAQYLGSMLGSQAGPEDLTAYEEAKEDFDRVTEYLQKHEAEATALINLRNEVDALEQAAESARQTLGEAFFRKVAKAEFSDGPAALKSLIEAVKRADRTSQGFLAGIFWPFLRSDRFKALGQLAGTYQPLLDALELKPPAAPRTDAEVAAWHLFLESLGERLQSVTTAFEYHQKRQALSGAISIEEHHQSILKGQQRLSQVSLQLWEAWIRLAPARLSSEERSVLGEFLAVVKLMVEADQQNKYVGRGVKQQYDVLFPKVSALMNCWAVTSLSARGRIPLEPSFFDLVVIDEASQCDIASALPLLFRAKRAVIIGDPQQLQHISKISPRQDGALLAKHNLLSTHAKWGYSPNSLFALASALVGPGEITMLRDHHRSHADIIGFSNDQFYEGRLRVATRYDRLNRPPGNHPAVRWIQVTGTAHRPRAGGALNHDEAKRVMAELERLILEQDYKGTVGVVTPFRAQANLLNQMLSEHPQGNQLRHGTDLLCESAHRFQGDERDVMIFSPVVTEGMAPGALGFLRKTGNLFNVAITRARAALIVVGDAASAAASGIDYLAKFSEYAQRPSHEVATPDIKTLQESLTPTYPTVSRPELVSDWERDFYCELFKAGFRPIPQYQVEKYALDFALFDGERRLDIEVDGERYHKAWNGELLYRDQLRNMRLIELGWDVVRFWVYEIRDDLEGCLERIRTWQRDTNSDAT